MKDGKVVKIFAGAKAIITGSHFVYAKKETGWFHGSDYVNKDAIYPDTDTVKFLCGEIAKEFACDGIEVVVGPTIGAVSLSQWTTDALRRIKKEKNILSVFSEEQDIMEEYVIRGRHLLRTEISFLAQGNVRIVLDNSTGKIKKITYPMKVGTERILKRGYDKIVAGKRCLVVEDILNSGITVEKTVAAIKKAGGSVIGVGALCNRSGGKISSVSLNVPTLYALLNLKMEMFPEEDCPICKEKGPGSVSTNLGKGKEFLVRKNLAT